MHYLNLNLKTNVADQEPRFVDWLNLKGKAGYHPWLLSNSGTMAVNLLVLGILTYLSNGCQGVFFSLEISRMIPATGWSVLHLAHIQTLDELLLRSIMIAGYVIQYKAKVLAGILTFVLLMAVIIKAIGHRYSFKFTHFRIMEVSKYWIRSNIARISTFNLSKSSWLQPVLRTERLIMPLNNSRIVFGERITC